MRFNFPQRGVSGSSHAQLGNSYLLLNKGWPSIKYQLYSANRRLSWKEAMISSQYTSTKRQCTSWIYHNWRDTTFIWYRQCLTTQHYDSSGSFHAGDSSLSARLNNTAQADCIIILVYCCRASSTYDVCNRTPYHVTLNYNHLLSTLIGASERCGSLVVPSDECYANHSFHTDLCYPKTVRNKEMSRALLSNYLFRNSIYNLLQWNHLFF